MDEVTLHDRLRVEAKDGMLVWIFIDKRWFFAFDIDFYNFKQYWFSVITMR